MLKVKPTEFRRRFGRMRKITAQGPVMIVEDGLDTQVLISAEDYRSLSRGYRRAFDVSELDDEFLRALEASEMKDAEVESTPAKS